MVAIMKLGRIVYIYWWQLTKVMYFWINFENKNGIFFNFFFYL